MSDATETGIQYPTTEALLEHLANGHDVNLSGRAYLSGAGFGRPFLLQAHERYHRAEGAGAANHEHREEWR